jgi:hypothetical protein
MPLLEVDASRRSPVYCPAVELDALETATGAAGRAGDSEAFVNRSGPQ